MNAAEIARRKFLHLTAGAATVPAISRSAKAQAYPTRPITMIVPFPAGSTSDATARVLAEQIRGSLGQRVIIENVSGPDGSIGTGRAARARPDGYTIELGTVSTHMLNGALYSLPYDVLNDFAPISPVVAFPTVLFAKPTMPAKDLNELIAWLKANPNKASVGIGSTFYRLKAAFFQKQTGTQFTIVPYRGSGQVLQDLIAGQIDLQFGGPDQVPLVRAGSIKAYAMDGDTRFAMAPDVPTFSEIGLPALSFSAWYALFAPKGTPKEIIDRLNAAAVQVLADPLVRSRLADLGFEIFPRERQTPVPVGNSNSNIPVMHSPQDCQGKHAACSAHVTPDRRVLVQRQVGSDLVVVFLVRCENVAKMALANDDDVIKTFPSDRAEVGRECPWSSCRLATLTGPVSRGNGSSA